MPLYKKGSKISKRQVALTSVICILLENVIKHQMLDFLVRHKLLNPSQHRH